MGDLSASAGEIEPHTATYSGECDVERCPPRVMSCIQSSTRGPGALRRNRQHSCVQSGAQSSDACRVHLNARFDLATTPFQRVCGKPHSEVPCAFELQNPARPNSPRRREGARSRLRDRSYCRRYHFVVTTQDMQRCSANTPKEPSSSNTTAFGDTPSASNRRSVATAPSACGIVDGCTIGSDQRAAA